MNRGILAAAMVFASPILGMAAVSLTGGVYTQDFDSLISTGTSQPWTNDSTLPGWSLFNKTPAALTTYSAGSGTSNAGSFYSFGATGSTERALGGVGSGGTYFGSPAGGTVAGWIAFAITNDTGSPIPSFIVKYDGEQWRDGGSATPNAQTMVMEYGFGPAFTAVGAWTTPGSAFNFTSPVFVNTSTGAAVDGNTAGLIPDLGGIINATWNNGDTLWIRWIENNDAGTDHGLAVDNFSITIPEPTSLGIIAVAGVIALRRRTQSPRTRAGRTGG